MYIIEYHDVRFLLTQVIFSWTSPPEKNKTTSAKKIKSTNKRHLQYLAMNEADLPATSSSVKGVFSHHGRRLLGCGNVTSHHYQHESCWKNTHLESDYRWGCQRLATPRYMFWFNIRHFTFHFQWLVLLYHGPLLFETFWEWLASHLISPQCFSIRTRIQKIQFWTCWQLPLHLSCEGGNMQIFFVYFPFLRDRSQTKLDRYFRGQTEKDLCVFGRRDWCGRKRMAEFV